MHKTRWNAGWKRPAHFSGLGRGGRWGQRWFPWACCLGLAVYAVVLAMATHWPPQHFPRLPFRMDVSDKLAHFGAYALLSLLVAITVRSFGPLRRLHSMYGVGIACGGLLLIAGLGLCDELTQPIVGRQFDWLDWTADLAGAATAAILCAVYLPMQNRLKMRSRISSV